MQLLWQDEEERRLVPVVLLLMPEKMFSSSYPKGKRSFPENNGQQTWPIKCERAHVQFLICLSHDWSRLIDCNSQKNDLTACFSHFFSDGWENSPHCSRRKRLQLNKTNVFIKTNVFVGLKAGLLPTRSHSPTKQKNCQQIFTSWCETHRWQPDMMI